MPDLLGFFFDWIWHKHIDCALVQVIMVRMHANPQFVPKFSLLIVKKTKFEEVYLALAVEVNRLENQSEVRQGQIQSHFVHTLHELSKIQCAIKIFIEPPEGFPEAREPFDDSVVDMDD